MSCPLCGEVAVELFDQDQHRRYFKCLHCSLVFVPRDELISSLDEKKRYDSHENSENDSGYREYLSKIADLAAPYLKEGESGLDFGCGRTTLLEEILSQRGLKMRSFDLYYHPQEELLHDNYDFIILSEVIEHLRGPQEVMLRLRKLLRPGGRFLIKTKLCPSNVKIFSNWWYKRDQTHVQFFNARSLQELSRLLGMEEAVELSGDFFVIGQS